MDMGQGEEAEQSLFSNLLCNSGPNRQLLLMLSFPWYLGTRLLSHTCRVSLKQACFANSLLVANLFTAGILQPQIGSAARNPCGLAPGSF